MKGAWGHPFRDWLTGPPTTQGDRQPADVGPHFKGSFSNANRRSRGNGPGFASHDPTARERAILPSPFASFGAYGFRRGRMAPPPEPGLACSTYSAKNPGPGALLGPGTEPAIASAKPAPPRTPNPIPAVEVGIKAFHCKGKGGRLRWRARSLATNRLPWWVSFTASLEGACNETLLTDAGLTRRAPAPLRQSRLLPPTGYSPDEPLGQSSRLPQGPETNRAVLDEPRRRLEGGQLFWVQAINYHKDGAPPLWNGASSPPGTRRGGSPTT